ncbi:MAG: cobalamin-dependent protein [Pirellulales bacterium]|nr:cobalamin-dependent protein [Pirellulales bacterium]
MNELNETSSIIVSHAARVLAGYAASELFESHPELREDSKSGAFQRWQNLFAQCLEELAAAIATNRPILFIQHVQWMQTLLTARGVDGNALRLGLESLSKALSTELPEEAASVSNNVFQEAIKSLEREMTSPARSLGTDSVHGRLAGNYLLAILEGDRARAVRLILDAAEAGYPARDLYIQVLLPAQEEAGRMWQNVEINVAEEHFATATTKGIMALLCSLAPAKSPNGKTLVASAVAGNQHDIGLQAVADFFEMDGWRVIQLGCDVPIHDLVQAVGFYHADLLALSVSLGSHLMVLKQTIQSVRRSERGASVKVLVGGRALTWASDLAAEFGADGYAADPVGAVSLGNALVGLGGRAPSRGGTSEGTGNLPADRG